MRYAVLFISSCLIGVPASPGQTAPATSLYLSVEPVKYAALLPDPPTLGSDEQRAELAAVRMAEATRTAAEVAQAQADDREESMFAYASVIGPTLVAVKLPLTAALSAHLRHESAVVNPVLKALFARPRPFVTDPSLHPVCERTATASYPSGHSMVGYLEAFALAEIVPERKDAILARAWQFAAGRVVCGVHYPSDVEASRTVALALYGALTTSGRFQQEMAAARMELRHELSAHGNTGEKRQNDLH